MPHFLDHLPRHLLPTGKGGVGKTSVACAAALRLASRGHRVLLVSTDPASNLGHVFGLTVGDEITTLPAVPGLDMIEIDPHQAAHKYRESIIAPVRGILPDPEIARMTEELSGSCTTEIASFNEFTRYLAEPEATAGYDHIIFDTAPTGHTLRLLELPTSWTDYLDRGTGDASCLGPVAGLDRNRRTYRRAVEALRNPESTRVVLVARPQRAALDEAVRTRDELADLGIDARHLVVNGVLPEDQRADTLQQSMRSRQQEALARISESLLVDSVTLRAENMVGVDQLSRLFDPAPEVPDVPVTAAPVAAPLAALVDELAGNDHGLIMTMGKGGVGKTTVAAAVAVALAERGHEVLLTTTDPAAHLTQTLAGEVERLTVTTIDPQEAVSAYRKHVMASRGQSLDEAGRAALAEDLRSPCTEEIAVFSQFSHVVNRARKQFVVVDTAPTGHTLLLMDATGSYHREVTRHLDPGQHVETPLMRLQDPDLTKVMVVTVPEPTPVVEARELTSDLERAGIRPWAWVVNQALSAARPTSPLLAARAAAEAPLIERMRPHSDRLAILPYCAEEPVGAEHLDRLLRS